MDPWRRALPVAIAYLLVTVALAVAAGLVRPVVVAGGSMRPGLAPGDVVLVRRGAVPRRGDIALLAPAGHGPVLHRVVGVDGLGVLSTRGDANPTVDAQPALAREVVGTVVAVLPVGSLVERWRGGDNRATLSTQSNTAKR